jgi:alpha-tubulin suppressor-like RCC1 family protein
MVWGRMNLVFWDLVVPPLAALTPSIVTFFLKSNISQSAAGGQHTLFVEMNGTVWGAGDNSKGQLGINNTITSGSLPTVVQLAAHVIMACGGNYHSLFLTNTSAVYAVGRNELGELGLGYISPPSPNDVVAIPHIVPTFASNVVQIVGVGAFSMLLTAGGLVFTTGDNFYGQLGLNDTVSRSAFTQIANLSGVTQIAGNLANHALL